MLYFVLWLLFYFRGETKKKNCAPVSFFCLARVSSLQERLGAIFRLEKLAERAFTPPLLHHLLSALITHFHDFLVPMKLHKAKLVNRRLDVEASFHLLHLFELVVRGHVRKPRLDLGNRGVLDFRPKRVQ